MQNCGTDIFDSNCCERLLSPKGSDDSGLGLSPRSLYNDQNICLESTTPQQQSIDRFESSNELHFTPCNDNNSASEDFNLISENQGIFFSHLQPSFSNHQLFSRENLLRDEERSTRKTSMKNNGRNLMHKSTNSMTVRERLANIRNRAPSNTQSHSANLSRRFSSQEQPWHSFCNQRPFDGAHQLSSRAYENYWNNPGSSSENLYWDPSSVHSVSFSHHSSGQYNNDGDEVFDGITTGSFLYARPISQGSPSSYNSINPIGVSAQSLNPNNFFGCQPSHLGGDLQTYSSAQNSVQMHERNIFEIMNCVSKGDIKTLHMFFSQQPQLVNVVDNNGKAAIHHAICQGQLDVVQFLIWWKTLLVSSTKDGENVLHLAASQSENILECLVQSMDSNSIQSLLQSRSHFYAFTPLHVAVARKNHQAVAVLLKNGANYMEQDENYRSPLHIAVRNNDVISVKTLLDFVKNNISNATLTSVTDFFSSEKLSEFTSQPAYRKWTPLHFSADILHNLDSNEQLIHQKIIELLISNNANMFARNEDDKTPDQMLPPKEKSETILVIHELFRKHMAHNLLHSKSGIFETVSHH